MAAPLFAPRLFSKQHVALGSHGNSLKPLQCQPLKSGPVFTLMMAGVLVSPESMLLLCLVPHVFPALDTAGQVASFMTYMNEHGRNYKYGSAEFEERLNIFRSRMKEVEEQNKRWPRLWTAGINELSDLREAELEQLLGWHGAAHSEDSPHQQQEVASSLLEAQALPPDTWMNWTRLHSLRLAPNQESCGSCWAVASSTVLQAHSEIYGGQPSRGHSQLKSLLIAWTTHTSVEAMVAVKVPPLNLPTTMSCTMGCPLQKLHPTRLGLALAEEGKGDWCGSITVWSQLARRLGLVESRSTASQGLVSTSGIRVLLDLISGCVPGNDCQRTTTTR